MDGGPIDPELLPQMMQPLSHRGLDGIDWWSTGSIALGCAQNKVTPESREEVQPLILENKVLVWDGRLDNRSSLIASLRGTMALAANTPDNVLVIAAYERWGGDRFVERLLGDFALALFDARLGELFLARDAIGPRPLNWFRAGDTVAFSSQIRSLLAHPLARARPNRDLLAEFFLMGPPQADSPLATFFEDVHSVAAGHVVRFKEGDERTRYRRYWDFEGIQQLQSSSFAEYTDGFRFHFERSVERRLRSAHPVAVSVSGGLDSSSILCTALHLARRSPHMPQIHGVTLAGEPGTPRDETVFVEEIERLYEIEVARVPATTPRAFAAMRDEVTVCEGPQLTVQWQNTGAILAREREVGARVALTGVGGDEMVFERSYLIDLIDHLRWGTAWRHLREYPKWDARHQRWFDREFLKLMATEHVPARLIPAFRRLRAITGRPTPHLEVWASDLRRRSIAGRQASVGSRRDFPSVNARSIYRTVRSLYWVGILERDNQEAAAHGLELAHPIFDRDLVSFLMSVPGHYLSYRGVPRSIMREGMRPVLPPAIADRSTKAPFGHSFGAAFESEIGEITSYLAGPIASAKAGMLDDTARKALPAVLAGAGRGEPGPGRALADLLKIELWLTTYFDSYVV